MVQLWLHHFGFTGQRLAFFAGKLYNKKEVIGMKITVLQPSYFMGENPDEKIADFLMGQMEQVEKDGLILLPEYANAGGISDAESEKRAMPRAKRMLERASAAAPSPVLLPIPILPAV